MSAKKPNLRITRRPFVDKANLMHKKDALKPRHQGEVNRLATNDPKLQQSKLNRAAKQKTVYSAADSDCENNATFINPKQANKKKLVKTGRVLRQKQAVDQANQNGNVQAESAKDEKQVNLNRILKEKTKNSAESAKDKRQVNLNRILKEKTKNSAESAKDEKQVNLNRILKEKTKNSVASKTIRPQLQEVTDCGNKIISITNASHVNRKELVKSGHTLTQEKPKQTIDKNQECTVQTELHTDQEQGCDYKSDLNEKASILSNCKFKSPSKELSAAANNAPSQKQTDGDASQINNKKLAVRSGETLQQTTVRNNVAQIADCKDGGQKPSKKVVLNNKGVRFKTTKNSTENLKKVLRKRKTKNYAELSNGDSVEIQEEEKEVSHREHVPVYLQKLKTDTKPQKDPFEFVAESPSRKRKGKRFKEPWSPSARKKFLQRKIDDWSDSESSICNKETYDKEMHEVLKRVRQKMEKSMVQRAMSKQMTNGLQHNNVKLQKPVSSVRSDVAVKAGPLKNQNKGTLELLAREIRTVRRRISNVPVRKNVETVKADVEDGCVFFGFADDESDDEIAQVFQVPATPGFKSDPKQAMQAHGSDRFTLLTSTPLPNSQRSLQLENRKMTSRPQINIISNVLLTPPRASQCEPPKLPSPTSKAQRIDFEDGPAEDGFFGFDDRCSEASSYSPPPKQRMQPRPWRGDNLNVTRNPHWLAVKDTSLPCYNQEMILEPKLLEKPMAIRTPARIEEPVQSSMLDFVSTSKSSPVKQVHNSSLFDCGEFSPIKDKNKILTAANEANVKGKRSNKGKRNILGTNKDFPPVKNAMAKNQLNVDNCFGFDSNDEEEKENVRVTRTRAKVVYKKKKEEARPMRVAMKQLKKVRDEAAEELLDKANFEEADESLPQVFAQDTSETQLEEAHHVGLFEDLEQVQPAHRSYEPKRRKRVRFPSVESIEEEEKPRRKRKDIRTPAEEQEFDKWAAEFNAMCEEVEKHSLETDKSF